MLPCFKTLTQLKILQLKGVLIDRELERALFEGIVSLKKFEKDDLKVEKYVECLKKPEINPSWQHGIQTS